MDHKNVISFPVEHPFQDGPAIPKGNGTGHRTVIERSSNGLKHKVLPVELDAAEILKSEHFQSPLLMHTLQSTQRHPHQHDKGRGTGLVAEHMVLFDFCQKIWGGRNWQSMEKRSYFNKCPFEKTTYWATPQLSKLHIDIHDLKAIVEIGRGI